MDPRLGRPRSAVPVAPTFFGMHSRGLNGHLGAPSTPFHDYGCRSYRLWDCGVNWRHLETSKGVFDWSPMDDLMAVLAANGITDILYVLGAPPDWATTPATGSGASYNPNPPNNDADWTDYIDALMGRYPAITAFEVWNEPENASAWTGSIDRLVELTVLAHDAIKANDPDALVCSPAIQTYADRGLYLRQYLAALDAAGHADSLDVIALHTYVQPASPDYVGRLARLLVGSIRAMGYEQPIWSTECGWGEYYDERVHVDTSGDPMPQVLAVSYIVRMYLETASAGIARQYFYSEDGGFTKLWLVDQADLVTVMDAGTALSSLAELLSGGAVGQIQQRGYLRMLPYVSADGRFGDILWAEDDRSVAVDLTGYVSAADFLGGPVETAVDTAITMTPVSCLHP